MLLKGQAKLRKLMTTQRLVTIVAQFVFCWVIAILSYVALSIGNGWELIILPLLFAIVVVFIGWAAGRLFGNPLSVTPMRFAGALILSILGAAILNIPGAWGFQGLLFPIFGAMIGYQLAVWYEIGRK